MFFKLKHMVKLSLLVLYLNKISCIPGWFETQYVIRDSLNFQFSFPHLSSAATPGSEPLFKKLTKRDGEQTCSLVIFFFLSNLK